MTTSRKIAIGIGVASGIALTALLITGLRTPKAREFMVRKVKDVRNAMARRNSPAIEAGDIHYL